MAEGKDAGKIAAIVDVLDQNRVLVDGPCTGVSRQPYRIKNLHLTELVTKFPFSARSKVVRTAWEKDGISKKWEESAWAKRMAMKSKRKGLTDFDRFKLMKAKSARNKILAKAVATKKKKLSKAGKL
jgi:large subunit ribosomal protein L14e